MRVSRKNLARAAGVLLAVSAVWWASRNGVTVTNGSEQMVHDLSVEVCDRTIRLGDLAPGASASASFGTPRPEDVLRVRCTLADGTVIDEYGAYVVWTDYGQQFRLVIRPDGMVNPSPR
jgi:hypothetical protein